jgi:hypothetical protein
VQVRRRQTWLMGAVLVIKETKVKAGCCWYLTSGNRKTESECGLGKLLILNAECCEYDGIEIRYDAGGRGMREGSSFQLSAVRGRRTRLTLSVA